MKKLFLLLLLITSPVLAQTTVSGTGSVTGQATLASAVSPPPTNCPITTSCNTGWFDLGAATKIQPNCPSPSPGGNTGCVAVVSAWGGGMADINRKHFYVWGGGHLDYFGNEVYDMDCSGSSCVMSRITNPSTFNNTCNDAQNDGNPTSRHTYGGLAFLPTPGAAGKMFAYSGAKSNCGFANDDSWLFDLSTKTWTKIGNGPAAASSADAWDYDPINDVAIGMVIDGSDLGRLWKYDPKVSGTSAFTQISPSNISLNLQINGVFDYVGQNWYSIGSGFFHKITVPAGTDTDLGTPSGCTSLKNANAPGLAFDAVHRLIVGWFGGNSVVLYNPVANTCSTQTFTGGPPNTTTNGGNSGGPAQDNGTWGRFRYFPSLGLYIVINDYSQDAFALRLTAPSQLKTDDFNARCAATGVIVCDSFDNSSVYVNAGPTFPASGFYPGDTGDISRITRDTTVSASGTASVRFLNPPQSGSTPAGYWRRLFAPAISTGPSGTTIFGQNSTFYVQYRIRFDSNYLAANAIAVGETQGGTTTWKTSIISNDTSTCANEEITMRNNPAIGSNPNPQYAFGYSQCGSDPFQVDLGGSDFLNQQGGSATMSNQPSSGTPTPGSPGNYISFNCHYQAVNNVTGSCALWQPNTWTTIYYKVHVGTWGTANSSIEAWIQYPGQYPKQILKMLNHILLQDTGSPGFNRVDLVPYWTSRDPNKSNGLSVNSFVWYDELIVSSNPIMPPMGPSDIQQ